MPKQQETELREKLSGDLISQVIGIRNRRRAVEERWLRSRRAWMNSDLDRRYRSTDSSPNDYNVPMGRRSMERTVVRGIKLLTPKVKWFEVSPVGNVQREKLENVDNYLWYVLRKKIRSRTNISQLVRCMAMYERCHIKTSIGKRNGLFWPTQRVVDPFSYYIFPETATSYDEAELQFEDFLFSWNKYQAFVEKGIVEEVSKSDLVKPDWPYHLVERLAYQGITDPTESMLSTHFDRITKQIENIGASFLSLTELWLSRSDQLYQVYILWNHKDGAKVVGFIKSEYDEPLYRSTLHRPLPNELYTNSMLDDITELSTLANDQLNRFQDAVDWEQGFIGINESEISRTDSLKVKGRAKWHFKGDPKEAVTMFDPPTSSTNQLRAWQIYLGLINSLGGTGTIAEGQPGRNMPRAGFAVNSLIDLGMSDIQDVAELIEQEVLTPSLSDIYKVSSQFIPEHQLIKIPGGEGLFGAILKKEDIIGDYEFDWIGSLQFQDDNLRAQRLMIFLNLALQPQATALLQQQGYAFNFVDLLRTVWRSGLGERGLNDVVMKMEELQQQIQIDQQSNQGQQGGIAGLSYGLPSVTNGFVQQ